VVSGTYVDDGLIRVGATPGGFFIFSSSSSSTNGM